MLHVSNWKSCRFSRPLVAIALVSASFRFRPPVMVLLRNAAADFNSVSLYGMVLEQIPLASCKLTEPALVGFFHVENGYWICAASKW
jgi:hypothetical protein